MIPLSDSAATHKIPFWVLIIIALNFIAFYLELTASNPENLIRQFALIPATLNFNDYSTLFPLVTSQFLHAGWLHILSNMWFLWIFGDNVEDRVGFILFPIVYLLSGTVGGLAQVLAGSNSSLPILGASGAVAGILGTYFAYFPHHLIKTLVPIFGFFTITELPAFLILLYWLVIQIFSSSFALTSSTLDLGGVAYFAHIGGFLTGFLIAKLIPQTQNFPDR